MSADLILNSISKYLPLSEVEKQSLVSVLEEKKLKKKQFFLHENEVCKHSAFVVSGCLRSYTIDPSGVEHILQFAPEGWWIADMQSFISGLPGKLTIDALEDSALLLLSRDSQEKLFAKHPAFERFFRIITEKSVAVNHSRLLDYMSISAEERYLGFCKRYPSLFQKLPQKQIAAYIGVTPEFLSKLRAGLARRA